MTLIAVAGDIATSGAGDTSTAALVTAFNPTYVITLGDNAYNSGSTTEFTNYYQPTWGAFKSKTHATPGNHDWGTANAQGYKDYFGTANVTNPINGGTYYSWDTGNWHIVHIDISSYSGGGGTVPYTVGSAQYNWLANDLAAAKNAGKHIIVCDHFPRYSSGTVHGSTSELANIWTLMSNNGVLLFLSGHEHSYERFAPMDATGAVTNSGVRQVVPGTGGAGLYGFSSTPTANSVFRLSTWGVLFLDLQDTGYSGTFRRTDQSIADSWTQTFTGQPALAETPEALLEQVGSATARRYAAKDSANVSMDTVKIIEKTAADGGGYLAVYQYLSGGTQWQVRLADSTDLLNWTFRTTLETDCSQPTIYRHPTAGYFTGCEFNAGAGGQLRIRRYATLAALLANTPTHTATITRTLSSCNEGTPNFYSVTLNPDVANCIIDIGYHYHWNCDVDRQARGTLSAWTTWTGATQPTIDTAVTNAADSRAPYALVRQAVRTAAAGTSTTQTGLTSTAGNLLVATVQRGGGSTASVTSITDSAGNTWAKSSEGSVVGQVNTQVSIWYAQGTGAITSLTLNGSGSWTWGINLSEWSGALTTGVSDGGSGAGRSVSPILTPTFTPTAGDLVIGALATDAATAVKNTLNFTSLADFSNGATLGRVAYVTEAVGDQEVSWTPGTGYTNAGVAIAGFKRGTGLGGNIGDRDNFNYISNDWVVIEGQGVKNDFATWRPYLYNPRTQAAILLAPVTAAGSTAFANPTATVITSPAGKTALLVTYFIPSQGAGTGEAGELIYYTEYTGAVVGLPARGIFYSPGFPEAWNQGGYNPATHYTPTLGFYSSATTSIIASHVASMVYGGFDLAISSWWGQSHYTNTRLPAILAAAHGTRLKICAYYEAEGNTVSGVTGSPNPTSAQITSDLNYIAANYINDPSYAWINGKPLIFVYSDGTDTYGMIDRWLAANAAATTKFYLVLKVFPGYQTYASQPDNWHQYGPAVQADQQGSHSITISAGYWRYDSATPGLVRDLTAWKSAVDQMNAAAVGFRLVTTFNEWGEGSSVESATQWASASGHGSYLDILAGITPTSPGGGTDPTITNHVGSAAAATSATASGFTTAVGAALVALVTRSGGLATGALTGITDSAGNTWTLATRGAVSGATNTRLECWTAVNAASVTSITFASGTSQSWAWNVLELTGMPTSSLIDVVSPDNSGAASSTTIASPVVATNASADVVIAAMHSTATTATLNSGASFTALSNFDDAAAGIGRAAYRITSATGSYNASWTLTSAQSAGVVTVALRAVTTTGGGGGGTTTPMSGYDLLGIGYDSIDYSYDGSGAVVAPPPPPPVVPPPPVEIPGGIQPSVPFATSKLYVIATYTKAGKRVAVLPYTNLQFEFLLNEPGNCRFSLPIQHQAVTRANIEEGVHEVWVYRKGELIFAGPIWGVATSSDGSALQVDAQGLLSYFRYRIIDKDMLWITTNTGPGIATYLVMWTQTKSFGNLGITVPAGYGGLAANVGIALGYKLSYRWWEQKFIYDAIKDLADNVTTGFDFEITPQRVFVPWQKEQTNTKPGLLRYPTHFRSYYFPRYGMQVTNDYTMIGPGDGAATLFGNAINTRSMQKYGLMEGTGSWGDAKTRASLNTKATKFVKEHGAPIAIPTPVLRGDAGPFLGTYRAGDRIRLQVDNGYDKVDRIERMTGYQLTVGANDEETVNVYFNIEDAAIVG